MKSLKASMFVIAIRKKNNTNECSLFEKSFLSEFKVIKNPFGKWSADPFLLEINNRTFLFAELFSNFWGKGKIYVREIFDKKNGKWEKCTIAKCHLSFPNVYVSDSKVYMMPETSENKELSIYECVDFPTKWKTTDAVIKGYKLVDSIYLDNDMIVSYDLSNKNRQLLFIKSKEIIHSIMDKEKILRPAGSRIEYKNKYYYPMQICKNSYGEGININEFDGKSFKTIDCLLPSDFKSLGKTYVGLHTYNTTSNYEVVDLKYTRFSFLRIIGKPFRIIFRSRKK